MTTKQGLILRCIGGLYTVMTADSTVECRARGVFRKRNIVPLAGDGAVVAFEDGGAVIAEILPRRNFLVRPPVANLDLLAVVTASCEPEPNLYLCDRMIAVAELKGIEPLAVFTKNDLKDTSEMAALYRRAGFRSFSVSAVTGEGVEALRDALRGRTAVFEGNSGVGKSSLMNRLDPRLGLETGAVSRRLGRGRHTTRKVELYPQPGGGFLVDTPGFSSVDVERFEPVLKEDLPNCFREFAPYIPQCRFTGCAHLGEKGCAVCAAVENGEIARSRYRSYRAMYEEVKGLKSWEVKNGRAV